MKRIDVLFLSATFPASDRHRSQVSTVLGDICGQLYCADQEDCRSESSGCVQDRGGGRKGGFGTLNTSDFFHRAECMSETLAIFFASSCIAKNLDPSSPRAAAETLEQMFL